MQILNKYRNSDHTTHHIYDKSTESPTITPNDILNNQFKQINKQNFNKISLQCSVHVPPYLVKDHNNICCGYCAVHGIVFNNKFVNGN